MKLVCDVTHRPEMQSDELSHGSPGLPATQVEVLRPPLAQRPESQSLALEHAEPFMRSVQR